MPRNEISPVAVLFTFLLHIALLYLAIKHFPQHHHPASYDVIHVSIPVRDEFHPKTVRATDLDDLTVPVDNLADTTQENEPTDKDRYYLPDELSQQVHVLEDKVADLDIPIRRIVTMTLYVNEAGGVDEVVFDDRGLLTEDEQKQLLNGFGQMVFLPGMRGGKIVKAIYKIRLEVNRKIVFRR